MQCISSIFVSVFARAEAGWKPGSGAWHHRAMGAEHRLAFATLEEAHRMFVDNIRGLSLEEMRDAGGGYRSILGLAKHTAAWAAVYHSYAFDEDPRHWDDTDWPRGLRDQVETTDAYVQEIVAWFDGSYERWLASVDATEDLDVERPLHWGGTAPLAEIIAMVAAHWCYHAGEINEILAIRRGEAWEYTEEVEENHISTAGHGVRPEWMTDEEAARFAR
jgi:DinB family protein